MMHDMGNASISFKKGDMVMKTCSIQRQDHHRPIVEMHVRKGIF